MAAIVDEKIFCCHGKENISVKIEKLIHIYSHNVRFQSWCDLNFFSGGLSPDLQSMEQIRRIMRPTDVPDQGLLCDLLWSDPDKVS